MASFNGIPIIDTDGPTTDVSHPPGATFGYVERDYAKYPQTMFAQPDTMQLIDPSEWDARYDEQEATQSSLEHLFLSGPGGKPAFDQLDQNGFPDCWCHSTGHSIMLDRLKRGEANPRLNAVAVATLLKETQGGWCGLSAKFARENGFPEVGTGPGQWPYQSRNGKDTAALRAAMALNKITEDFVDLTRQVYDQNLTRNQLATCLFNNVPCPVDFNWWGHSVCAVRWVRLSPGEWALLILNSWGASWGRYGLGLLQGSKMVPNGSVATRLTGSP